MSVNRMKDNSLLKDSSTRLRFSVWVIIANFIMGIVGMILGTDLTALGVFLGLANTPLYAYILGRTFRGSSIPREYFNQPHNGSGGIGDILNNNGDYDDGSNNNSNYNDIYIDDNDKEKSNDIKIIKRDKSEIG